MNCFPLISICFKDFIYLRDRESTIARVIRSRGRGRSRFPIEQGVHCGAPSQDPEIMTWVSRQMLNPLSHLGTPLFIKYLFISERESAPEHACLQEMGAGAVQRREQREEEADCPVSMNPETMTWAETKSPWPNWWRHLDTPLPFNFYVSYICLDFYKNEYWASGGLSWLSICLWLRSQSLMSPRPGCLLHRESASPLAPPPLMLAHVCALSLSQINQ